MTISSIADHAQACLDRDYLVRWFPDNVRVNGQSFGFSEVELAIIEGVLRCLENDQSFLIHNPLPDNRIPVAVCLAYARTQDPRFPSQGIIGHGRSMLMLPALSKGYVSTLDAAEFNGIGKSPALIERQPIDSLSDARGAPDLFTAKHGFEFDVDTPPYGIGAIFVDIRKPEWGRRERRFPEIQQLSEASKCPVIFYTNQITEEAALLQENIASVSVTTELLMTADGIPVSNPSETARVSQLLSDGEFSIEFISVGFPEMKAVVKDMAQMKKDLQQQGIATIEVGWLFNLLTKLPIRPEHWDDVTGSNYYQQGVRELLENLKSKASRLDGGASDLLINYCHAADYLHGLLNRTHPVQDELFTLIREAEEENLNRAFVVRGDFEREAVLRAITLEDGPSLSSASIRALDDISAGTFDEVVLCRPLDYDSYAYDFPLAQHLKVLQFESWTDVIKRRIDRGCGVLEADVEVRKVGEFKDKEPTQEPTPAAPEGQPPTPEAETGSSSDRTMAEPTFDAIEPVDDYVPDVEGASEQEVIETLEREFKQTSQPTHGEKRNNSSGSVDLRIELDNGEVRTTFRHTRVTILRDNGDIGRVKAADLDVGETVVLIESAADDIYDLFLESAHDKEKIRKCESVVDRWHNTLKSGLEEITPEELLDEIQERGSEITDPQTIELWADGSAIGPQDPENVRRVLSVLEPEMEPTWEATVQAMKDIRTEHRQIGKQARKAIESRMSSSMTSEFTDSLDENLDRTDIRKATITDITERQ